MLLRDPFLRPPSRRRGVATDEIDTLSMKICLLERATETIAERDRGRSARRPVEFRDRSD